MSAAPLDARPSGLPPPSAAEREHSDRVVAHLVHMIAEAEGWISFADYMHAALYAPGLGYYAAGAHKLGLAGDFVTAPELTPLFGQALAAQLAQVLTQVADGEIIEVGPGSGCLAADVLTTLAEQDALPARYLLLEVSPDLRERQRRFLAARVPELMPRVLWIDRLPEPWRGAVIANEVLDAVPAHLVARRGGAWFERGVTVDATTRLAFCDRPLAPGMLRNMAEERFPAGGDYTSEVNPAAEALVTTIGRGCDRGLMLLVDYGFPAAEYYHPQRDAGTLMAHYRHRALADPFSYPGLVDMTAHVDFSAVARAGLAGGMTVAGFTSQAQFLVACGLLDALARSGDPQSAAYLRAANAVQKLTSAAEMGELFKALALTRELDIELVGFRDGDRSHRL
ncbi:MAG TPA: SAM-dependent methyltransferase [Casimicrobiaceae bacterium]|jgi:SAM-dependent MidA family methyltransferase|nr:SAM-dependent methyltransferase [Casimicrobiaceae bacterium]